MDEMMLHVTASFTIFNVGTFEVEQWPNKMGRKNGVLLATF
jgi:hypothetical protein